jgi:hypothetical protein
MFIGTFITLADSLRALTEITSNMNDVTRRYSEQCRSGVVDLQAMSVRDQLPHVDAGSLGTSPRRRTLFVNWGNSRGELSPPPR